MISKRGFGIGWIILLVILAIFFRSFNFQKSFSFAHDQDLYSWIARDIVVNGHQRLVGQITSVDGVFIGSFYYYLMAAAYAVGGMNPLAVYPVLMLISVFNLISLVWLTDRHFGKKAALVAGLVYAISYGMARFDKWSVPTQPTLTWSIWMMGIILELYKGNLKFLPILAVLYGFIWQIHIALIPIAPVPLVALLNNKKIIFKKDGRKWWGGFLAVLIIVMAPLVIFELKHNFSQITSMLAATKIETGAPTGLIKAAKVVDASGRELQQRLIFGGESANTALIWVILILVNVYLGKVMDNRLLGLMWLWIGLIGGVQFLSKRVVSEYYFTNIIPIVLLWIAILLARFDYKILTVIMMIYLVFNLWWLVKKSDEDIGYFYREKIAGSIADDARSRGFDCMAVNYIADPGVGVGFRYLLWWKGMNLKKPGSPGVPVYNIIIPWQLSARENPEHYGRFGLLKPISPDYNPDSCHNPGYILEPMLGYTE